MGTYSKKARNDEIKRLWKIAGIPQYEIGEMYGIGQSRVSAIIHDRLPPWHYCIRCNGRTNTERVCAACKILNRADRDLKHARIRLVRALERVARRRDRAQRITRDQARHEFTMIARNIRYAWRERQGDAVFYKGVVIPEL